MFTNHFTPKHLTSLAALMLALGLSACGQQSTESANLTSAAPSTAITTQSAAVETASAQSNNPAPPITAPTTAPPTTEPVIAATTTEPPPTPRPVGPTGLAVSTVPGEAIDYGPVAGRPLTIVGVGTDDVLNFRIAPSPNATIVTSHPVTLTELDIYTLGEAWASPTGVWWKVNVMGTEAWANQAYLAVRGGSVSIFDEVAYELQILTSASIEELALEVAATRATQEPMSRITIVTDIVITPLGDGGGFGHVFIDVLDIGDHMQKGERLLVEVQVVFDLDTPEPDDIAFVVLNGVEMIYLQGF